MIQKAIKLFQFSLTIAVGFLLVFAPSQIFATHIVGAELYYRCLDPVNHDYEVTLVMYRDCNTGEAPFDDPITFFVFPSLFPQNYSTYDIPKPTNTPEIIPEGWDSCVGRPYTLCVERAIYKQTLRLPPITGGYHLGWARCCRNASITNLLSPLTQGVTFSIHIPGPEHAVCNSSPVFRNELPVFVCVDESFYFDHSALDADGDSLIYLLSNPLGGRNFQGVGVGDCGVVNLPPSVGNTGNCAGTANLFNPLGPPPYQTVAYASGQFNPSNPFGPGTASINSTTGFLTFNPQNLGIFVVAVSVREYRNGVLLSENKRDIQIHVIQCSTPGQPPNAGHNLSVIDSLSPGLSVTYGINDTIYAIAGTSFCYEASIWDSILTDSLISFPVSEAFGNGAGFFPPAATISQTNSGVNPIQLRICWQPACEYIGDTIPLLIGGRDAKGCTNYNFAYDSVWVIILPPPVVGPKVGFNPINFPFVNDTLTLRVDSLACFRWFVKDTLQTGHLNYAIRVENLSGASVLTPSLSATEFSDSISIFSCLRPGCDMMNGLFRVILEANDNTICPPDGKDLDTLYLRVPAEPNPPPTITHDLSGNNSQADTIFVNVHDGLCYEVLIHDTFPALNLTWKLTLLDISGPYSGPSANLIPVFIGDSIRLQICWTPNCENAEKTFLLITEAIQENSCNRFQSVFDSVYVMVNELINPPPNLSHSFLPGYALNGDSLVVAADSTVCYGFELKDSGAHTFLDIEFEVQFGLTGLPSGHQAQITWDQISDTLISGEICLTPGCDFSGELLRIATWGRDTFDCNSSNWVFDTLYIRVSEPFNQSPSISHDISMVPNNGTAIEVHPEGVPFCYEVILEDPDGQVAQLIASGNSATFKPGFGNGNLSTVTLSGSNPLKIEVCWDPSCYEKNQTFWLVVCGKDTSRCNLLPEVCDSVEFKILDCSISTQNIFTPNGDGTNDVFVPFQVYGMRYYHLKIFDRWGGLLFDEINQGWNGTLNNAKEVPEGVYFWTIEYEFWSAQGVPLLSREAGNVTLMR